jgi:ubiquinone/menaquinone biosynthesis C-methylase UbiE
MILRIGVGDIDPKQEGYLNVDIRDFPNVDVVADAKKLPFKDGEYDGVESRNLVEHFSRLEIDEVFKEWARVLKKGGTFTIETIDMGRLMDNWRKIPSEDLLDGILGKQTYPENFHKMAFTQDILKDKLFTAGLRVMEGLIFDHRNIPRMVAKGIKA